MLLLPVLSSAELCGRIDPVYAKGGMVGLGWCGSERSGFTFCSSGSSCPTPGWKKHRTDFQIFTQLVACRSEFVTAEAAGWVGVLPPDEPCVGGVGVDVAAEPAGQIGNRDEDAAGDDLAFDLGEPDLDLVEPGRVSGRESETGLADVVGGTHGPPEFCARRDCRG